MLQYQTTEPGTLELLRKLMKVDAFKNLRLVGGTALALQIGHRNSVDLDLFGNLAVDEFEIDKQLKNIGTATLLNKSENINIWLVEGIKVDLVNYDYPWLGEAVTEDGLRLAGINDIAAMKLSAITGRGTRKDFIDLYYLLQKYMLREMLGFYSVKYSGASEILVLKSLTYFDDADSDEDPKLFHPLDWKDVKSAVNDSVRDYVKTLS